MVDWKLKIDVTPIENKIKVYVRDAVNEKNDVWYSLWSTQVMQQPCRQVGGGGHSADISVKIR